MEMNWYDLTPSAQETYLNHFSKIHAEWNGISIVQAKKRLREILENTNNLFTIPVVSYEQTGRDTNTL